MTSSLKQWLGALGLTVAGAVAVAANSPAEVPVTPAVVPSVTQNAAAVTETPQQPITQTKPIEVEHAVQEQVVAPAPVVESIPKLEEKAPVVAPVPVSEPETKAVSEPTPIQTAPNGTYTNTAGNEVPSPYYAPSAPAGASAKCRDGTYSFSQSRRGTCSRHGGVAEWL
ncbi:MAG: DUF3761 domain-containing protein [Candidatus Magasanikbacteria bacterium]|nr:DUF3761 domain-containing protein [Candidatus Magasanikbacteria bacterium]